MKIDFDKVAEVYDIVRASDPYIIRKIIEKTNSRPDFRILDLGCGTGNNTVLLAKTMNSQIYGMDQSEGMLSKAKEKSGEINFFIDDAAEMKSIEDEFFNLVFMVDVIHHINDLDRMFKNLYRTLKPEGIVMIFTDSHDHIINNRLTTKYFPETLENELKRYLSEEKVISSMIKSGFSDVEVEDLIYPEEAGYGEKLITLAETKSYSMFRMITQEAINRGIEKIREDMIDRDIIYCPKTQVITGRKLPQER